MEPSDPDVLEVPRTTLCSGLTASYHASGRIDFNDASTSSCIYSFFYYYLDELLRHLDGYRKPSPFFLGSQGLEIKS